MKAHKDFRVPQPVLRSNQSGDTHKGTSMAEIDFLTTITRLLVDNGPILLGLIMLLSPFGIPVPATPIILAVGTLVKTGSVEWSSYH